MGVDPFCGRGTTLFAARVRGLGCVGIDSNPIAAAIAAAKLAMTTPQAVVATARSIVRDAPSPRCVPEGDFWNLCYHPETLRLICTLRERLVESCTTAAEVMLRALLLGILHGPKNTGAPTYLSNQMPRTYATKPNAAIRYWTRTSATAPPKVNVLSAIARRARFSLSRLPPPSSGEVYFGDVRQSSTWMPEAKRFHWIITSPPYLGMATYHSDQWLRNWFLGGPDTVAYSRKGQMSHSTEGFTADLSEVWKSIAARSAPGARLIVRFGSLPSLPVNAQNLLRESIRRANAGWRIRRWMDAGNATAGRRQSDQFTQAATPPANEVDLYATLPK